MYARCFSSANVAILVGVLLCVTGFSPRFDTCSQHRDICGFVESLKEKIHSVVASDSNVREALEVLVDDVLDFKDMAKFVMGNAWKTADQSQREKFVDVYGNYARRVYIIQLYRHAYHKMKIMSVKSVDNNSYKVRVRLANREQKDDFVVLEFYVVNEGEELKIVDIRINNSVSIAVSQRSVVNNIVKEQGVAGAILHFESENAKPFPIVKLRS